MFNLEFLSRGFITESSIGVDVGGGGALMRSRNIGRILMMWIAVVIDPVFKKLIRIHYQFESDLIT